MSIRKPTLLKYLFEKNRNFPNLRYFNSILCITQKENERDTMNISKIYVRVDNKDYAGLYWLSKTKGQNYISVSYEGLRKSSSYIKGDTDQIAKQILSDLIESI